MNLLQHTWSPSIVKPQSPSVLAFQMIPCFGASPAASSKSHSLPNHQQDGVTNVAGTGYHPAKYVQS
jgi:hypothetical protein